MCAVIFEDKMIEKFGFMPISPLSKAASYSFDKQIPFDGFNLS